MSGPTRPTRPSFRQAVVALPVVIALLAASLLIWSRSDPARSGGFCTTMTLEMAGLLRASNDQGNEVRDPEDILQATLGQLDHLDPTRLGAGAPIELQEPIRALEVLVPDHAAAVRSAAEAGRDQPDPPGALTSAFVTVLARYYQDCI